MIANLRDVLEQFPHAPRGLNNPRIVRCVALQKREEVQQQRLSDVSFLLFFKEMLFRLYLPVPSLCPQKENNINEHRGI
ncbi:hypothetical protein [Pseudomonas parasichuanensis]|uniref:hypothetical protein n=1 Tax=Pseudomonas parasichuanensis TaxID=2892329 RepID=UPI001F391EB5|nr:hypothetical protein [Pseudomonas parasichuanensis]